MQKPRKVKEKERANGQARQKMECYHYSGQGSVASDQ
jgi:hypothetical protein